MSHEKGKNTAVMGIVFWPLGRSGKPRPVDGELHNCERQEYVRGYVEM